MILTKRTEFQNGKAQTKYIEKKIRGNFLRYVYRASDEMEAPEIKRQLRNHWKILQKALKKYNFSNVTNED